MNEKLKIVAFLQGQLARKENNQNCPYTIPVLVEEWWRGWNADQNSPYELRGAL